MALSPADFAAYSRATGAPYPESPEERAEMVPEVRAFRQNQLQRGDNQGSETLALGIGLGLGLAGLGAGALKLRGRGKGQPKKDTAGKSSVKMADLSDLEAPVGSYGPNVEFKDYPGQPLALRTQPVQESSSQIDSRKLAQDQFASSLEAPLGSYGPNVEFKEYPGGSLVLREQSTQTVTPAFDSRKVAQNQLASFLEAPVASYGPNVELKDYPLTKKQEIYQEVAAKPVSELPQVSRPQGAVEESMLITDPNTGEVYRRGGDVSIRAQQAQETLNDRVNQLLSEVSVGESGEMLAGPEVALETRQMTGSESSSQSAAVRRMEKEEESLAKNILSELAQETLSQADSEKAARIARNQVKDKARVSDYMSDVLESVISETEFTSETIPSDILKLAERAGTGNIDAQDVNTFKNWAEGTFKNDPVVLGEINETLSSTAFSPKTATLTETYETFGEPAAQLQNIDAVDTASDQIDSRFEAVVQRDVDSVFEGKPAVAAEKLGVYGPLSAEDTAALARDQMINLRAELEAEGLRPGSTRFERALAERFKTGETTKIGDLGITGKSLEQVSLPAGPMRQTVQSVETSQSPTFSTRSVANVGEDPFSDVIKAASGTSIRGRSRIQNQPEQFRQRVDKSGRRIDDEFGVELTELVLDTGESRFSRQVVDPITGKLTPEFAPKGQRAVQLFQGEGQPTKTMYIPESDPGGIGIYGEERSFASGPIVKVDPSMEIDPVTKRPIPTDKPKAGQYTKTAQRKPTDLPYPQKKGGDLTDMSTKQLQTFASNAVKKNPRAAQAAMSELERREASKLSMQASEAVRRANIEGRDPQKVLRSMGFGV